jgi:hypothetical protein
MRSQAKKQRFFVVVPEKTIQVDGSKGVLATERPLCVYVQYILRLANFFASKPE